MFQHLNIIATTQQLQHNTPTMLLSQYQTYQLFINQLISILHHLNHYYVKLVIELYLLFGSQ